MRSSTLVAAVLPLAVTAAPAVDLQERGLISNLICLTNKIIVNALLVNPVAVPYCAAVAGVPSLTITNIVTQTPASLTITVPINAKLPALTITNVLTETVTSLLPLPTVTLSCLNSAFKAPTAIGKRAVNVNTIAVPKPTELANIADSLISTLCSCMSIPVQTNTVLSTKTLLPGTVTLSSAIAQATSTIFSTLTITKTATSTGGAGAASGVAGAAASAATALLANGFTYKKFTHTFGTDAASGFSASAFKSMTPDWTGVLSSTNFATDYWPAAVAPILSLDRPATWDASKAAILFQGFFVAPKTGSYTFATEGANIDNWGYLWTGDNALNWNDANAAYKASRLDSGATDGATTLVMNAGDAIPITYLWANGGGAAKSQMSVSGPDGLLGDLTKSLVQPCSG